MKLPGNRIIVSSENPKSIFATWAFAVFWCGISFALFYVFAFKAHSLLGGAIGGLFSLLGIVMLWQAFRMTVDYRKFGAVTFTLQGEDARAGSRISALVEFAAGAVEAAAIEATLECKRVTWTRGDKGGPSMSEQSAWTLRKTFPLRRTVRGASAAIAFDIPSGAFPSDLPGDEDGGSGLVTYRSDIEIDRAYHRWEIRVTADVPGLDLERTFRVKVRPGIGVTVDAGPRVDPAVVARLERASARTRHGAGNRVGLAVFAIFVSVASYQLWSFHRESEEASRRRAAAEAARIAALPKPVKWSTPAAGWTLAMPAHSSHAGVAARGLRVAREGNGVRVAFDRIEIEKNPAASDVIVTGVYLHMSYDTGSMTRKGGSMGGGSGVSSRRLDVTLDASAPAAAFEDYAFHMSGMQHCLSQPCNYLLGVDVRTPGGGTLEQPGRWVRRGPGGS